MAYSNSKARTYYKVVSPSYATKKGKVSRIQRVMWVEVLVTGHDKGVCIITPITGYGSMSVRADKLKVQ